MPKTYIENIRNEDGGVVNIQHDSSHIIKIILLMSSILIIIVAIKVIFIEDKKENYKVIETNVSYQTTHGNNSPNIKNNQGDINVN